LSAIQDEEAHSILSSHVSKEEAALAGSTVGERLPYNDYTTIDWLHDLVQELTNKRCANLSDSSSRSKTRTDGAPYTSEKASELRSTPFSTHARVGSP
jgi:hypothetical protein